MITGCGAGWLLHSVVVRSRCKRETGSLEPLQMTRVTASSAKSRGLVQGERQTKSMCEFSQLIGWDTLLILSIKTISRYLLRCPPGISGVALGREQAGKSWVNFPPCLLALLLQNRLCLFSERNIGLCSPWYWVLQLIEKGHLQSFHVLQCKREIFKWAFCFWCPWSLASDLEPLVSQCYLFLLEVMFPS